MSVTKSIVNDSLEPKEYLFGVQRYKDFYSIQQGVLLALLNSYCSITLKKPRGNYQVTQKFPTLKKLQFAGEEEIDIVALADSFCRPLFLEHKKKVKKEQAAQRRFEKNKKVFIQNLLIDILMENGFFFESKMARKSSKTLRLERIERVFYNGRQILDFDSFISLGNSANSLFISLFTSCSLITIPHQDATLSSLTPSSITL